jgi:hypothetical protein
MPRQLVSHSAVLIDSGRQLLVYGGTGELIGEDNSNQMYVCDLDQLLWRLVDYQNDDLPKPGYGQAVLYDQEERVLYVCGGTDGNNYWLDLHRFELDTGRWKLLARTPAHIDGRYRHKMALWQRKLFILGGTRDRDYSSTIEWVSANCKRAFPIHDLARSDSIL